MRYQRQEERYCLRGHARGQQLGIIQELGQREIGVNFEVDLVDQSRDEGGAVQLVGVVARNNGSNNSPSSTNLKPFTIGDSPKLYVKVDDEIHVAPNDADFVEDDNR